MSIPDVTSIQAAVNGTVHYPARIVGLGIPRRGITC